MTVLPTIRHQLLQAAERTAVDATAVRPRHLKWRLPSRVALATSHLVTAALIAVTVVVAVGAIVLLGHSRHPQVAAPGSAANSRGQLLQTLGILRASPTATDQAATACVERTVDKFGEFKCYRDIPDYAGTLIWLAEHSPPRETIASMGYPRWDFRGIRIVPLGRSTESVALFPGNWRGTFEVGDVSSAPSGKRNWGLVAVFGISRNETAQSLPTTVGTFRAHGLVLGVPSEDMRVAIVVPDGVARITVKMVSLGRRHWLENATATVHGNIATLQLKAPNLRLELPQQFGVVQVNWFNARGQIIRHTTNVMQWGG